jgi:hypothetical protein
MFPTLPMAVGPLICFAAYIGLLQPHSDDMSRVVDQLLKLITTFIGLSRLSRSGIIYCINVFTSLLGLVIVSHLSPRGLGRFKNISYTFCSVIYCVSCLGYHGSTEARRALGPCWALLLPT